MTVIKTYRSPHITFYLHASLADRLPYSLAELGDRLLALSAQLAQEKQLLDHNPYPDLIQRGTYVLSKTMPSQTTLSQTDLDLDIFPTSHLIFKCSQGRWYAPSLKHQFDRTLQLEDDFASKLTPQEQAWLGICPVYLYWQIHRSSFFREILVMPRIGQGISVGDDPAGLHPDFLPVFGIPDRATIARKPQFVLHRAIDPKKQRQLLKLQTVYLFRHLWQKGIPLLSLNQKNLLLTASPAAPYYTLIDPTADFFLPITPLYNGITAPLCR